MNKRNLLMTILMFAMSFSNFMFAQKVLDSGMVKMEITKVTADDPQMAMQLEMMKGTQTEIYFEKDKNSSYMSMMGGMLEIKVHVDEAENKVNMFMDMMGQKIWVETTGDEAQNAQQKEIAEKSVITYDKSDTKKIQGYDCYKFTVTNPDMEDLNLTGYITPDIKSKANIMQGFQSLQFEGFPMEFTMGNKMFGMTNTAVAVKDKVDSSKLKFDSKGYKKMTMEEFQKSMGGMGGFGF